eukprot:Protomagalhaensia_wolfi_Nauph_80__4791@NODE_49_length_4188_cov_38_845264_g40_i0_p2_GENE_NODE_49_length_4188_cov_38_845264_g40_i0NODE_49_length_4188_cov_38_845264_g40_i0_p2_ORF_typecomplete_len320_score47_92TPR_16/PF13432_6/9_4e05TPR_16/PF13432_6/1_8e05TPR_16/PF13432_6/5_8e09TPR_16/PF13432_6/8_6e10TPR_8/PF13181_6/0_085TPR_8/PF13181_6/1_5e02TPR_8/PF13181_6/1_1e03TPR_8/PF13181_6/0_00097TPR_8/PF13181_6/4_6e03TPR_8/PF13181_6/1_3e05TPR_8/PF13181_6/5_7TPR_8/PF13181_6/6_8e05TPR_9/PF13371_6/0_022TPR_9/PF
MMMLALCWRPEQAFQAPDTDLLELSISTAGTMTDHRRAEISKNVQILEIQPLLPPLTALRPAEELDKTGDNYFNNLDYCRALKCYRQAQQLEPNEALYLHKEALVHLRQGSFVDHKKACEKAIQISQGLHQTQAKAEEHFEKGHELLRKQRSTEAVREYNKAISLNPSCAKYYRGRSDAYSWLDEYHLALRDADIAINHDSSDAPTWNLKGECHFALKQYPRALEAFNEALKLDGTEWVYRRNRYNTLTKLGQYESALVDADALVELSPKNALNWNRKGECHFFLKEYQAAMDAFKRASALSPNISYQQNFHRARSALT